MMNIGLIRTNINNYINNNKSVSFSSNKYGLKNDVFELTAKIDVSGAEKTTDIDECSSTDCIKQSQFYNKYNFIPAGIKILDGFSDPGGKGRIYDDGRIESDREIIVIDRNNDEKLKTMINDFSEFAKSFSEEKNVNFLKTIVQYLSNSDEVDISKNCDNLPVNEKLLLGDIINRDAAVCRHKALLYKIIGDEAGLNIDVVRGRMDGYRHAWNVVHLSDGKKILVDTTNYISFDITNTKDNTIEYKDKNGIIHTYTHEKRS